MKMGNIQADHLAPTGAAGVFEKHTGSNSNLKCWARSVMNMAKRVYEPLSRSGLPAHGCASSFLTSRVVKTNNTTSQTPG